MFLKNYFPKGLKIQVKMLVKVACLCYSGSMDFFQIVFHFKSKLVETATEQISSKIKLSTSVCSQILKKKNINK